MEEQLAALIQSVNEGRAASDAKLEAIQQSIKLWRPAVSNPQHQLDELRSQVGKIALHPALADPDTTAASSSAARRAAPQPSAGIGHHGPAGHGEIHDSGGSVHGVVTTLEPPPVTGAFHSPVASTSRELALGAVAEHSSPHGAQHSHWVLPKLDFPQFDGDNPQFWRIKCEKYFDVYGVHPELWVHVATLHFTSNAARWLQLHDLSTRSFTWEKLCESLCSKFGRDQYQAQLRQFAALCQTGSVTEYMNHFEEMMHQLLAHNAGFDPLYFTTKFLDGLRAEIRAGVVLHRPQELDTAFSLALLQEEILEALPHREYRRLEGAPGRAPTRPLLANVVPPARVPLPVPQAAAEDRRGLDAARAGDHRQDQGCGNDRIAALRNYRRARGLCFKCGERWGQGHQCAATVQLHIVEELLDLLQADDRDQQVQEQVAEEEEQIMSISKLATTGQTTPRTVRLLGLIDDQEVLILVDSRSSHSFISEAVADRFANRISKMTPVSVKVADGGLLSCSGYIKQCQWST
ncbi:hypothetical protein VPH35_099480 [Triticum aestivum]